MLLTTQDRFDDHEIAQTLGLVRGNTIRARHLGKDILAVFRGIVGGEVSEYTKMMAEAREQALDRMIAAAETLGADAITDPVHQCHGHEQCRRDRGLRHCGQAEVGLVRSAELTTKPEPAEGPIPLFPCPSPQPESV